MTDVSARWREANLLLDAALDRSPHDRAAFLDDACGGDRWLRDEVGALVQACESAEQYLESPVSDDVAPLIAEADLLSDGVAIGARIGPYRVVGEAGRGGMGIVYVAERDDGAFDMRVALKLLVRRPGVEGVNLRRFREERQILATLEHPGIARLLDGGVTGDGMPWFAMEYVDGMPIDRYCREHAP